MVSHTILPHSSSDSVAASEKSEMIDGNSESTPNGTHPPISPAPPFRKSGGVQRCKGQAQLRLSRALTARKGAATAAAAAAALLLVCGWGRALAFALSGTCRSPGQTHLQLPSVCAIHRVIFKLRPNRGVSGIESDESLTKAEMQTPPHLARVVDDSEVGRGALLAVARVDALALPLRHLPVGQYIAWSPNPEVQRKKPAAYISLVALGCQPAILALHVLARAVDEERRANTRAVFLPETQSLHHRRLEIKQTHF